MLLIFLAMVNICCASVPSEVKSTFAEMNKEADKYHHKNVARPIEAISIYTVEDILIYTNSLYQKCSNIHFT